MSSKLPELTDRQAEILSWIRKYTESNGLPPTQREIGNAHDISSTQGVRDHLKRLEEKGRIEWRRNTSRGILVKTMEGT